MEGKMTTTEQIDVERQNIIEVPKGKNQAYKN